MPWYEHWYDYTGTLADWAMAGSAIGAYFLARDYFSDIIKKDGYELIKKLHLELLPSLQNNNTLATINALDIEVLAYINGGVGVFDDDNDGEGNSRLRVSLTEDLQKIDRQWKESIRLEREINELIQYLETYGWHMRKEKEDELLEALFITKTLYQYVHSIIIFLREILSREAPHFLPRETNAFFSNYNSDDPNSPLDCQSINLLSRKLAGYHQKLYDPEKETPYTQAISSLSLYFKDGKHLKRFFKYKL